MAAPKVTIVLAFDVIDQVRLQECAKAAIGAFGMGHVYDPDNLADCAVEALLHSNIKVGIYDDYGLELTGDVLTTTITGEGSPTVTVGVDFNVVYEETLVDLAIEAGASDGEDLAACAARLLLPNGEAGQSYPDYGLALTSQILRTFPSRSVRAYS